VDFIKHRESIFDRLLANKPKLNYITIQFIGREEIKEIKEPMTRTSELNLQENNAIKIYIEGGCTQKIAARKNGKIRYILRATPAPCVEAVPIYESSANSREAANPFDLYELGAAMAPEDFPD
jgi:hypothetical protein